MKEQEKEESNNLVVEDESSTASPLPIVSFGMIYYITFLYQLEGNIIIPTLWEYVKVHFGESVIMYGMVLSISAGMEVIGSIVLGFWSDRKPLKYPMITALSLFVIGNLLFVLAWDAGFWMLVLARAISGLGFGGTSMVLAFITHHTTAQERNHKIAMYWLVGLSTNVFGPLLTYLVSLLSDAIQPSHIARFLTLPGVFNIVFYFGNVIMLLFLWPLSASHHVSAMKAQQTVDTTWGLTAAMSLIRSIPSLAFVCLYIKLVFSLLVSVFQAIASPITDSDTTGNSLLFVAIGALIMFGVILAKLLNKKLTDYTTLQIGQVVAFISLFGLLKWPIADQDLSDSIFGLASIALTLGNSIGITICTAAYSKAIGQYHPRKGVLMGWFVTAAAVGRIIGPILSCVGLQTAGLNVVGTVLIVMSLISVIALVFSRVRMRYVQLHDESAR